MDNKMVVRVVLSMLLSGAGIFAAQEPTHISIEDAIAVYAAEFDLDDQQQKELATRLENSAVQSPGGMVAVEKAREIVGDLLLEAPTHGIVGGEQQELEAQESEDYEDIPLMEEVSESEFEQEEEKKEAGAVQEHIPVKPSKSKKEGKRSPEEKELLLYLHQLGRDERLREREEAQARGILVRPGKEKGPGGLAQPGLLDKMAEQTMSFLPQRWNIQIPAGQQFVDIGRVTGKKFHSLAVSPDGRFVVASTYAFRPEWLVWDMVTGEKRTLQLSFKDEAEVVFGVAFRSEEQLVVLSHKRIYEIDINTLERRHEVEVDRLDQLRRGPVIFSIDGNYIADFSMDKSDIPNIWDVATGQLVEEKKGIAFLHEYSKYIIDAAGRRRLATVPIAITGTRVGWFADGIRVLTKADIKGVGTLYQVWNTQTREKEHDQHLFLAHGEEIVDGLIVSPDGRYMLCAVSRGDGLDVVLRVYDFDWQAPVAERGEF